MNGQHPEIIRVIDALLEDETDELWHLIAQEVHGHPDDRDTKIRAVLGELRRAVKDRRARQ